jgi:hypothetical protein
MRRLGAVHGALLGVWGRRDPAEAGAEAVDDGDAEDEEDAEDDADVPAAGAAGAG